jgi:hypothetical protein
MKIFASFIILAVFSSSAWALDKDDLSTPEMVTKAFTGIMSNARFSGDRDSNTLTVEKNCTYEKFRKDYVEAINAAEDLQESSFSLVGLSALVLKVIDGKDKDDFLSIMNRYSPAYYYVYTSRYESKVGFYQGLQVKFRLYGTCVLLDASRLLSL